MLKLAPKIAAVMFAVFILGIAKLPTSEVHANSLSQNEITVFFNDHFCKFEDPIKTPRAFFELWRLYHSYIIGMGSTPNTAECGDSPYTGMFTAIDEVFGGETVSFTREDLIESANIILTSSLERNDIETRSVGIAEYLLFIYLACDDEFSCFDTALSNSDLEHLACSGLERETYAGVYEHLLAAANWHPAIVFLDTVSTCFVYDSENTSQVLFDQARLLGS